MYEFFINILISMIDLANILTRIKEKKKINQDEIKELEILKEKYKYFEIAEKIIEKLKNYIFEEENLELNLEKNLNIDFLISKFLEEKYDDDFFEKIIENQNQENLSKVDDNFFFSILNEKILKNFLKNKSNEEILDFYQKVLIKNPEKKIIFEKVLYKK